ncbi:MAG TPA: carboxylating nicotinate-nucleotide diphosphorylase [Bacteroidales bacterium]|jgi:nicotinate-nucleotide pyrophosphorylase (carboxylating)|nr:carboxylating nicotinate-nucleotide diphosphorylase [Bacteroidales bacterium]
MDFNKYLEEFIDLAIREDIGDGDHTSQACIPPEKIGKAKLLVKQEGILSGSEIAQHVFKKLDPEVQIEHYLFDGQSIKINDIIFLVTGKVLALLQAERLVLNLMQRMSGIATQTHEYVTKLEGLSTKILETRKTTPGMRLLEKMAVRHGGGTNHRLGLYDMIMIKDNHIDFAGGIVEAIKQVKEYLQRNNKNLKVICEVRSLEDIEKVLEIGGVDRILLDNFSTELTKQAVGLVNGRIPTESSGGITIDSLRSYAECGVDYISVGALTHQIKSLDLSLKAIDY